MFPCSGKLPAVLFGFWQFYRQVEGVFIYFCAENFPAVILSSLYHVVVIGMFFVVNDTQMTSHYTYRQVPFLGQFFDDL